MKYIHYLLFVFLLFSTNCFAEKKEIISGKVQTPAGEPVVGCVVSDGLSVVQTDINGIYSFQSNDSTEFVFISVPSAYEMPVDNNGLPLFYQRVTDVTVIQDYNFVLTPYADGGAADINHIMIGISDPQVQNSYETWRFGNESIKDIKDHVATFPEGTPVYGVVVGDLVWDEYDRFHEHTENVSKLGFPVFNVIGNHDHDYMIFQDWGADHYFKEHYGPTYYSFNRGNIHYITLDNIEYINATGDKSYKTGIVSYQLEWLKKDLETVHEDMYIVFLAHAPFEGSNVIGRQTVYNLVNSRRNTHAITGHHHRLTNYEINPDFYDHTLGAIQGAFWSGDQCADGTPNGYGVFQAGATGFVSWYYKATGYDKDYQLRVYPPGSYTDGTAMEGNITANIWNYDSKWGDVWIYENGERNSMYQFIGIDPLTVDFMAADGDTRPNYPGSDGGTPASRNPGVRATPHMFYYIPKDPNAAFVVEVTDRNKITYTVPVLRNLMVANFTKEAEGEYYYRQDFDCFKEYPNQYLSTPKIGKCTYVQGHSPIGWYACTSGSISPDSSTSVSWKQFNYLTIDNGNYSNGGLFAYGNGNHETDSENDPDRCLGTLVSDQHRNIHFGVLIENNTNQTFNELEIEYVGKMWRGGTIPADPQSLTFSYATNPDVLALRKRELSIAEVETVEIEALTFTSPVQTNAEANAACDGNDSVNQSLIKGKIAVKLYPGDVVMLRWEDIDDGGSNNALAIDDLMIKAIPGKENSIESTAVNVSFYNVGSRVYFDEAPLAFVHLYDVTGRVIGEIEAKERILDLSSYTNIPGVYFLKTPFGTKKMNISPY